MGAQAVYYLIVSIDLTLTGLVGLRLAPNPALVTLPLTLIIVVGTAGSFIAGNAAAKFGYRPVMLVGALCAVVGGLLSALAVVQGSFVVFCVATAITGGYRSTGGFLRFIASEYAPEAKRQTSLAAVMYGGIIAAAIGPFAAVFASTLTTTAYVGSCLLTALLGVLALFLALVLPRGHATSQLAAVKVSERWGNKAFLQSVLILVASGLVMTLVMAAGPLANQHAGHSSDSAALMIQWHLIGMFAPSALSAWILKKWGALPTTLLGAAVMALGCVLAFSGAAAWAMVATLLAVGIGWNILFVAGSALLLESYPQGRGAKLQGFAEGVTAGFSALGSFAAAGVLELSGWRGVNVWAIGVLGLMIVLLAVISNWRPQRRGTSLSTSQ